MFFNFNKFSKIPLNFNFENSGEFLNFCSDFLINFSKILQKSLMSIFLLNVILNWNFGDAIAVQDLSGIHVWKFVSCSLPTKTKSVAAPDSHPVITISHDEVIDIFAFSSARQLNYYSVIFCIFCGILYFTTFSKRSGSPEAKSWSRHW